MSPQAYAAALAACQASVLQQQQQKAAAEGERLQQRYELIYLGLKTLEVTIFKQQNSTVAVDEYSNKISCIFYLWESLMLKMTILMILLLLLMLLLLFLLPLLLLLLIVLLLLLLLLILLLQSLCPPSEKQQKQNPLAAYFFKANVCEIIDKLIHIAFRHATGNLLLLLLHTSTP